MALSENKTFEVDGSIHELEEIRQNDQTRQKNLEADNLTVIPYTNDEIRLNKEEVIDKIEAYLRLKSNCNERNSET